MSQRFEAVVARAERAEAMYEALIRQLPGITYEESLDDGRTISVSSQVEDILGYTSDEWLADPLLWVQLIHPDDRARVVKACKKANKARRVFRADYRMRARDGRLVWIQDVATLVRGTAGAPICWQGVMFDVSSRHS